MVEPESLGMTVSIKQIIRVVFIKPTATGYYFWLAFSLQSGGFVVDFSVGGGTLGFVLKADS